MNKFWKGLLLSILIVTLSVNTLPIGAEGINDDLDPSRYAVAFTYATYLTRTGTLAKVDVEYQAGSNLTLADIYTYLQRYVNGVWRAASTTQTCAWNDQSTSVSDYFTHYMTLTQSGSYRLKTVLYFYGTGGDRDRLEDYDYLTYNP